MRNFVIKLVLMKNIKLLVVFIFSSIFLNGQIFKRGSDLSYSNVDELDCEVQISGNGLIIAHSNYDTVKAYEWNYSTGDWSLKGNLFDDGLGYANTYGYSMSFNFDGSRIAISSIKNPNSINSYGYVQIYEFNNVSQKWDNIGNIEGTQEDQYFGSDVDFDSIGNNIIIGSSHYKYGGTVPNGSLSMDGYVEVYEYINNSWSIKGSRIDSPILNEHHEFGSKCKINSLGTHIIIGANGFGSSYYPSKSYVYKFNGLNWVKIGADLPNNRGTEVSITGLGNKVCVSDNNTIKVFEYDNNNWVQLGNSLSLPIPHINNSKITTDGLRLLVADHNFRGSAPNNVRGMIKIYDWTNGNWVYSDSILANSGFDNFAKSADMSDNGQFFIEADPTNSTAKVYGDYRISSINKIKEVDNFMIYPNPTQDILNISKSLKGFKIYDYKGSIIMHSTESTNQINISNIPPGYYSIVSGTINKRFIKL